MQHTDGTPPVEYNDANYCREVLQLEEGRTEPLLDDELAQQAEKLCITITRPSTPNPNVRDSVCDSAVTVASDHARTASSGSQESNSTGMTSRLSNELLDDLDLVQTRKRSNARRRSLSFSEYEKYVAQTQAQQNNKLAFVPPQIPAEPASSVFSVSTRRSYQGIRNGFKNRFRARRKTSGSKDNLK
jgi:hypothetical protein